MAAVWVDVRGVGAVNDRGPRGLRSWVEALELGAPDWHADAVCREHPEVNWFPLRGEDPRPAKRVCEGCLVREECRSWALDQEGSLAGIWAGTSQRDRRRIHRETL